MAKSYNKVILVGNLTKDPESNTTQQGKTISRIRIAVDDSYKDRKRTYFFDVVCWEGLGEIIKNYTKKGDKILVEGRLTQSSWESNVNGNKVMNTKIEIVAENILLLSPKGQIVDTTQRENDMVNSDQIVSKLSQKEDDYKPFQTTPKPWEENGEEGEIFDEKGIDDYDDITEELNLEDIEEDTDYGQLGEDTDKLEDIKEDDDFKL